MKTTVTSVCTLCPTPAQGIPKLIEPSRFQEYGSP